MIVYTDLKSGDQILSDSFPQAPLVFGGEEIPNMFTVQSKMISKGGESFDTGANASAEEAAEEADDGVEKVNNIIDSDTGFGYQGPLEMSKAEFMTLYKSWCKDVVGKIKEAGDETPKAFKESAKAFVDLLQKEYKNFEIYQTKNFDSLIVGWWDEGANTVGAPKFIYFTKAVKAEKY